MTENNKKHGQEITNDEFDTDNKVVKTQRFIYNNSKTISYIALGVIVLVAVVFFVRNSMQKTYIENTQKAMVALDRIMPYYDAPDYKKALFGDSSKTVRGEQVIGLIDITDEYGDTKQAKIAALYAGNSYLALNKAQEAIEYFEIAAEAESKIVLEGGYAGLGASKEILGEFDEAVEYYEKAAEIAISDIAKARYNYYAASNYEKIGDKENAEKIYREIIAKNKFTEFANYAKSGLVRLGMKID